MNIWLVNLFDPLPDENFRPGRYTYLALMLAEMGHSVTWWSSNFFHTIKAFRWSGFKDYQVNENLRIILINTTGYKKNIGITRILSQYLYAKRFFRLAKHFPAPDVLLVSIPPLYSALLSIKLADSFGAKVIVDVQDLWPDAYDMMLPGPLKPLTNNLFFPVTMMADSSYRNACGIMSMSEGFLDRALKVIPSGEKKPAYVLYLGIDLDYFDSTQEEADGVDEIVTDGDESFVAVYAGMIGGASDIHTIMEAAQRLRSDYTGIKFVITGAGPLLGEIENRRNVMQMDNVITTGFLDYPHLKYLLMRSSVGLVTYGKGVKTSFPNKPYDYMAAGLPLISSIKGEFEEMMKSEGIGLQYEAGDPASLAQALARLYENQMLRNEMGHRARRLAERRFDRKTIYPGILGFIEEVLST